MLEVSFADDQLPILFPDQPLLLTKSNRRIRFPVFATSYRTETRDDSHAVRHITVHFLFLGDGPLELGLASAGGPLLGRDEVVQPQRDRARHQQLLEQWWRAYGEHVRTMNGNPRTLQQLMQRALARRLKLDVPPYPAESFEQRPLAALEHQFERSVSTLLGIDSLLLAVPQPDDDRREAQLEPADQPLPPPMNLAPVQVIAKIPRVSLEPLVFRVPADCFYFRCGSLDNYAWLRQFVSGWGGNLQEIVSLPTLDHPVRQRIERQLAVGLQRSQDLGLDRAISDMAVIGYDFFFRDGAALGVLFEARNGRSVASILQQQRRATLEANPDAAETTIIVHGFSVSRIETPDHSVRSFYVQDSEFHLVTNCEQIVRKFLETRDGRGSLGGLGEYRHAISLMDRPSTHRALIYLSDPFFRQLASPHYRTEVTRRAHSLADLHELAAARVVADSEVNRVDDIVPLIELGYLPRGFGRRSDGAEARLVNGEVLDALRGRRGTFLPIPDMSVQRVTASEVAAFHQFAQQYRQNWGRVDPLAVTISSGRSQTEDVERVRLGIYVTPYARARYAFLASHLAPASTRSVREVNGDVLAIDATLKDPRGRNLQVHMGLRDRAVPFRVEGGKLHVDESLAGGSFASSSQYVAVNPAGAEGLQVVQQFLGDLQRGPSQAVPSAGGSSADTLASLLQFLFGTQTTRVLALMFTANSLVTHGDWTIYARDSEVRSEVSGRLRLAAQPDAAQIRFAVADPEQTQVASYLHAFAYLESRKASGQNVQMLNELPAQLGIPAERAATVVADVFAAKPVCPLGGQFRLTGAETRRVWRSTGWREGSLYEMEHVPDGYRFPFLDWLRGISLRFVLSQDTLRADVELWVRSGRSVESAKPVNLDADDGATAAPLDPPVGLPSDPLKPGDRVCVTVAKSDLRVGSRTLVRLPRGSALIVLEVRGDWVGVESESESARKRGWITRRELGRR